MRSLCPCVQNSGLSFRVCCICKEVLDRKKLSDKEWKEFQLDHVKVCKASVFKSQLDDVLLLLGVVLIKMDHFGRKKSLKKKFEKPCFLLIFLEVSILGKHF